ncbi:hypothetical protein QQF64_031146 [Cirrhinus molitorella]|uniref:Secreted protein n=1 Tax=Cirrhinus molitorella TaxID=172907 RepID=A0ABR3N5C0_9TELE
MTRSRRIMTRFWRFVIMAHFSGAGTSPGAFNFSEPARVTSSRPPVLAVSHGRQERHRRELSPRSARTRAAHI